MKSTDEFAHLQDQIVQCKKCPRLVDWREDIARQKTKRFIEWNYWGRPVPGFGDPCAELLLVGLAPAAHGGNRTGRMFTGDRSGDWLYRALFKAGFANQPASIDRNDGLTLRNCYITATCRCAPPQNKLLPIEIANCRSYLLKEIQILENLRVVIGLGRVGFENAYSSLVEAHKVRIEAGKRKPMFRHGVQYQLNERLILIGSYHPSQQNTFTGKLTEKMLDAIFNEVTKILHP
jgi:uracil-DNA glycosylase family 4